MGAYYVITRTMSVPLSLHCPLPRKVTDTTYTKIFGTLGWVSVGARTYFGGYYRVSWQGIANILAAIISCVFKNDMTA